jgi:hypothetical protein
LNQPFGEIGADATGDRDPLNASALKRRRHRLDAPYDARVLDQLSDQAVGPPNTNPGDLGGGHRRQRRSLPSSAVR